ADHPAFVGAAGGPIGRGRARVGHDHHPDPLRAPAGRGRRPPNASSPRFGYVDRHAPRGVPPHSGGPLMRDLMAGSPSTLSRSSTALLRALVHETSRAPDGI